MGDKLKQFIDDNRDDFDSEIPGQKLFSRLNGQLPGARQPKRLFELSFMQWAATILAFVIASIVLYYQVRNKDDGASIITESVKNEELLPVSDPVYASQIDRYQELIGLQQTELRKVEKEQPALYKQFAVVINQLDSTYRVLKSTLANNPNKEILLEAMISNLQLQSELLNRQLLIIKEIKQKSKAHEKSSV